MAPNFFSKDNGVLHFVSSHKFMTFIIASVTVVALYHVKMSIGDSWWKSRKSEKELKKKLGMGLNILEYFKTDGDAGRISWAHAVNSLEKLQEALKSDAMMFEADVQVDSSGTVIMAHPPATTSDLTMENFLNQSISHHRGVKLDFKTPEAARAGIKYVGRMKPEIKEKIWINADVITGTGATPTKFDVDEFLSLTRKYSPKSMISLGWTLGLPQGDYKGGYDKEMVKMMHEALVKNNVHQDVTFAVEVTYTLMSLDNLEWLLSKTADSSLTIWFHKKSVASLANIVCIREKFGKDRVYLDMPPALEKEFKEYLAGHKQVKADCKIGQ